MIKTDEDALVCDLAETYHIFDYRQLPVQRVAVFAYGLPSHSRIKLLMSNMKVPLETLLTAHMADMLSLLLWTKTEDATRGDNRPKSIYQMLVSDSTNHDSVVGFASGEDFDAKRLELLAELRGEENGN